MRNTALLVVVGLVVGAALLRVIPHPPNFAPIVALALFAGAYLPNRRWALLVPLAAMALSDLLIGLHDGIWFVYASVLVVAVVGMWLRGRVRPAVVGLAAVSGSVLFFVLTNLAVWATSGIYALTVSGLAACYVAAIPFFHNALAGDSLYTAALFGGYALLTSARPELGATAAEPR